MKQGLLTHIPTTRVSSTVLPRQGSGPDLPSAAGSERKVKLSIFPDLCRDSFPTCYLFRLHGTDLWAHFLPGAISSPMWGSREEVSGFVLSHLWFSPCPGILPRPT